MEKMMMGGKDMMSDKEMESLMSKMHEDTGFYGHKTVKSIKGIGKSMKMKKVSMRSMRM